MMLTTHCYVLEGFVYTVAKVESDTAFRWVDRESNLMFTLSNDGDQRKNSLSHSLSISVNERQIGLEEFSRVRSNKKDDIKNFVSTGPVSSEQFSGIKR